MKLIPLLLMSYLTVGGYFSSVSSDSLPISSNFDCGGTLCGKSSSEPISQEVRNLRSSAACTLNNENVQRIIPRDPGNPTNVQNVESIFPESKFEVFFPNRDSAYTYKNFLQALGKYPAICASAKLCPKILANMFAHFQQETAGLVYQEEINKSQYCADWSDWIKASYPCKSGKMYYGRGAKQLSWNYNYGAFSTAMFGDPNILLESPELVATTWLNFASAMWFFVTPQPPKPSMLQVIDGSWKPNGADSAANLQARFGATTMVINGALECGAAPSNRKGADNRATYYKDYAGRLGVDITGENLLCSDSSPFSSEGSAGKASLYWGPSSGCSLVTWQTAYSALVEGDYARCKGEEPTCAPDSHQTTSRSPPTFPVSTVSSSTPSPSTVPSFSSASTSTVSSSTPSSPTVPSFSSVSTSTVLSSTPSLPSSTSQSNTKDSPLCSDPSGLYSHPFSCQKYYQCSISVPYEYSCPGVTVWNDALKQCDWPANVDCKITGQTVSSAEPLPPKTSTSPSTTQSATRAPSTRPLSRLCANSNLFYSHETDCSQFYQCVGGVPQALSCVEGTAWNNAKQICDWKDRVQCENGPTQTVFTTLKLSLLLSTSQPTSQVTTIKMPGTLCANDGLYPHESDNQKYYQCYEGVPYEYSCVDGTFWNTNIDNCDWIQSINTTPGATAGPTRTVKTTIPTTKAPSTSTRPCTGTALHHSHPLDCHKYYICFQGVGYEYSCSGGLVWNSNTSACDWALTVPCRRVAIP